MGAQVLLQAGEVGTGKDVAAEVWLYVFVAVGVVSVSVNPVG